MGRKPIQLIVVCITIITLTCLFLGAWLAHTGGPSALQSGILFSAGGTGLGGMIALLSSTRHTPDGDEEPTKVEVTNSKENPAQTQDVPKTKN